jgi:hypothetical protein
MRALERIQGRSVEVNGCWEWRGGVGDRGYGLIRLGRVQTGTRSTFRVHRVAYQVMVTELPQDLELDHLCRNHRCWNPEHLDPVPHRENVLRGESPSAYHAKATHCPQGHPYSEANTYLIPSSGARVCRTCKRESNRKRERRATD